MGIMELLGKREKPKIVRAQRSPYMNLAYGKLPTCPVAWSTPPAPLANLTDEKKSSHLTTPGATSAAGTKRIRLDLGQVFEVYQIEITNLVGGGIKSNNALNAGTVKLLADESTAPSTQRGATQTPSGTAYEAIDPKKIGYNGEGIAVRGIELEFAPDGVYTLTTDLSEILVWGC